MANSKGSPNIRNLMYPGKHALLPPKCPFPCISPSYADYVPTSVIGSKNVQNPKQANAQHQRTSSETLFVDEQPSWLDDLLNEPDTPVRRGHRRSSSDSFAYVDAANASNMDYAIQDQYRYKNMSMSIPSCESQDFDCQRDARHASLYGEMNLPKQKNRQVDIITSTAMEKQVQSEPITTDLKAFEKNDGQTKSSTSETDTKRAKQQFAQRSRVRKLQYIAELERNVQALQAEGTEVSAELEFLNQQNIILSMENKSLKQRLESLTQEQLIKYCWYSVEQEVLEREIGRLRVLYQQYEQQQPQMHQQQPSLSHRRSSSRDVDSQFANLSLKHKDVGSSRDPVTGPLRI